MAPSLNKKNGIGSRSNGSNQSENIFDGSSGLKGLSMQSMQSIQQAQARQAAAAAAARHFDSSLGLNSLGNGLCGFNPSFLKQQPGGTGAGTGTGTGSTPQQLGIGAMQQAMQAAALNAASSASGNNNNNNNNGNSGMSGMSGINNMNAMNMKMNMNMNMNSMKMKIKNDRTFDLNMNGMNMNMNMNLVSLRGESTNPFLDPPNNANAEHTREWKWRNLLENERKNSLNTIHYRGYVGNKKSRQNKRGRLANKKYSNDNDGKEMGNYHLKHIVKIGCPKHDLKPILEQLGYRCDTHICSHKSYKCPIKEGTRTVENIQCVFISGFVLFCF